MSFWEEHQEVYTQLEELFNVSMNNEEEIVWEEIAEILKDEYPKFWSENMESKSQTTIIRILKLVCPVDVENITLGVSNSKPFAPSPTDYFTNKFILNKIIEKEDKKKKRIMTELGEIPQNTPNYLMVVYNKSISIRQSNVQKNGAWLEKIIVEFLTNAKIKFKEQVTIDKSGKVIGFNMKKNKTYHILDIVIGDSIVEGKSITDFKVLTCKTTCRERWTQDDWSLDVARKPNKIILITISDDYPLSERFGESSSRKIMTCKPKKKDDRQFKLNFENLLNEL